MVWLLCEALELLWGNNGVVGALECQEVDLDHLIVVGGFGNQDLFT